MGAQSGSGGAYGPVGMKEPTGLLVFPWWGGEEAGATQGKGKKGPFDD